MTLADLEQQRAALPSSDDSRAQQLLAEQRALAAQTLALDQRLWRARSADAELAALGDGAADRQLLTQMTAWRQALVDELLSLPSRSRDPEVRGRERNLTLSIKTIDRGPGVLNDTGFELLTTRLGQLMRDAGVEPSAPDLSRNFVGVMPWPGTLTEIEKRIATHARRRAAAQATLDEALLDDDARAARDAEAAAERTAFNAMNVRIAPDGVGLVIYDAHGEPLDLATLTPVQRKAFEKMDALHRPAHDEVTS